MLVKDVEDDTKTKNFHLHINSKNMNTKKMGLLLNRPGDLAIEDVDKAEVTTAFFASVFTNQVFPTSVFREQTQGRNLPHLQVRTESGFTWEHLTCKSPWNPMGCTQQC